MLLKKKNPAQFDSSEMRQIISVEQTSKQKVVFKDTQKLGGKHPNLKGDIINRNYLKCFNI